MKKMAMLVMTMAVLAAVPAFAAEKDSTSSKIPCTAVDSTSSAKHGDDAVQTDDQGKKSDSSSGQAKGSK